MMLSSEKAQLQKRNSKYEPKLMRRHTKSVAMGIVESTRAAEKTSAPRRNFMYYEKWRAGEAAKLSSAAREKRLKKEMLAARSCPEAA